MDGAIPIVDAQNKASPELKAVIAYLRSKNGPKARRGVLNGKRVDYFKGKTAIKCLLAPAYAKTKKVPKVTNEEEASALMVRLLPHAFFLQTDRPEPPTPLPSGQPRPLQISPQQSFSSTSYYTWFVTPSALTTYLGSALLVLILLAGVMFPLWPPSLRLGVYYLSLGVLGLIGVFMGIAVIRLIIWVGTSLVMKRGIWWFPNLFEDVGFVDSFIPFWAWDTPTPKKSKKSTSSSSSKSSSSKSSKSKKSQSQSQSQPAPVVGLGDAPSTATAPGPVTSEGSAMHLGGQANMRQRQQAYVEDAGDDE
ncbi:hypothetical protein FFLO_07035 [Filobasidium floriforme]|uniref:Translocation protein SEC62 n=1 Tax=Filobasidium floriforme TaxID=5210 RepID=A0A8K0NM97_9TREE|nr:putative endoplasmic reticulum receptor [Filobasidium floriforme]KAG7527334.1 hypothetical protein FFLO_07035 [Filobasidium floriforme]KAH8078351.1 putative endoplasmic reticulum receptor [Filobasidium floriforme]